jgi:transcriptional regulator with XRE-family HTH domain
MNSDPSRIVAAILRGQQESGLSLRALAFEAGVDPSLLTKICRGERTVTPETEKLLVAALERWSARYAKVADSIRQSGKRKT